MEDSGISKKGFNRLDFDVVKRVGEMVGFDIAACARKKKSCGPGCDWLVQDKRYYTLMLLKHIEILMKDTAAVLPADALAWYKEAKAAAEEYSIMEKRLYPVFNRAK